MHPWPLLELELASLFVRILSSRTGEIFLMMYLISRWDEIGKDSRKSMILTALPQLSIESEIWGWMWWPILFRVCVFQSPPSRRSFLRKSNFPRTRAWRGREARVTPLKLSSFLSLLFLEVFYSSSPKISSYPYYWFFSATRLCVALCTTGP